MEQLTLALTAPITLADLPPFAAGKVTIDPDSGCWRGTGLSHDRDGYARVGGVGAHRRIWTELVGPVADDLVIDHVATLGCIWRDCLWLDHLEPVTGYENWYRGQSPTRLNMDKTACGVCRTPYSPENTYYHDGHRDCRRCIARRQRECKQRQRALGTLAAAA